MQWLGFCSGEALWKQVREARALVLPSEWYENAPMSVLEAYASGTPVIGADIGGIPEMIDADTGWVFRSGDAEDLARVLSAGGRDAGCGHRGHGSAREAARRNAIQPRALPRRGARRLSRPWNQMLNNDRATPPNLHSGSSAPAGCRQRTAASRPSPNISRRTWSERGWKVTVYCQEEGSAPISEDEWQGRAAGQDRGRGAGAAASVRFDWQATRHAAEAGEPCLTLGYNTAAFCALLRAKKIPNVINMDGIEWQRAKWGPVPKTWFWLNDWAGSWLGDHLVADHPDIKRHLETRVALEPITVIPYGADEIVEAPVEPVARAGIEPGKYMSVVARPEPRIRCSRSSAAFPEAARLQAGRARQVRRGGALPARGARRGRQRSDVRRRDLREAAWFRRCASIRWRTCTATRSAAPIRRWWRRSGPAIR